MNDDDWLAAFDEQTRGAPALLPDGAEAEWDGPALRITGQHRGMVGLAPGARVAGADLDRLIVRQRDLFAARGEAVEWKAYGHDLPEDLPDRLRAAGFVPQERETVMVGLAAELAVDAPPPEGVVVRRVTGTHDLRRIADLKSAVWGDDGSWLVEHLAAMIAADPDGTVVLTAEAAGEVVCAAWLEFVPGTEFAGLWGGSTLPAWRGRGIYRALVAARARTAVERGTRFLQVDASDESAPILRRLGLRPVTTTTPFVWAPPEASRA
ncbi:acetyltransferase (GNAT) family protein [Nocardiopsis sp. Huas11]|uniref:GNAT family N-acetyltransferase n=1 Tax=Nocardiopsis sp. Huas11 TaxID=2183912 RepID=UPI000EAFE610|nr:GNAT family N-acetyltransferase [Nocardiopsis sp. Huas11]RKS06260.1 acetyltransferase (GNAT) family protein [Nocardiopsis sp. Huas11]